MLAIDCEMDQIRPTFGGVVGGMNIPCKVSVVNDLGIVILDTLIKPSLNGVDLDNLSKVEGYKSLIAIHGIKSEWLADAPSFWSVREHIMELCGKVQETNSSEGTPESSKDVLEGSPL